MEKIKYIQVLRIFCAVAIIILHASSMTLTTYSVDLSDMSKLLLNSLWVCCRFAVPLFVMITGYLLLQPNRTIDYNKIFSRYIKKFGIILLVLGTFFAWMEIVFTNHILSIKQIPLALYNMITGNLWDHMWYLYLLIGIYLIIPLIKHFVAHVNVKEISILVAILFVFTMLLPLINKYVDFRLGILFPIHGVWLLYLLIGYLLSSFDFRNIRFITLVSLLTICLLNFIIVYILYEHRNIENWASTNISYDSPLLALLAIVVFLCFKIFFNRSNKVIEQLASTTLGIYIFHPLWLNLIFKVLRVNPWEYGILSFIGVIVIVFFLSCLTTLLYKKMPIIGKYI